MNTLEDQRKELEAEIFQMDISIALLIKAGHIKTVVTLQQILKGKRGDLKDIEADMNRNGIPVPLVGAGFTFPT